MVSQNVAAPLGPDSKMEESKNKKLTAVGQDGEDGVVKNHNRPLSAAGAVGQITVRGLGLI